MDNHIILVRFNQTLPSNPNPYLGNPSWMEHRIGLFQKYTLKSLLSQSDPNYHLFLLSDPDTPNLYKKKLEGFKNLLPNIEIIYTNEYKGISFINKIKQKYLDNRKNNSNEIILSRCDNDDLISIHYNYAIKESLKNLDRISLVNGLIFDIRSNKINSFPFPKGPFVSIKSTLNNINNPLKISHHDIKAHQIHTDYPMWCWVIHDKNIHNTMKGVPTNLTIDNLTQLFGYE